MASRKKSTTQAKSVGRVAKRPIAIEGLAKAESALQRPNYFDGQLLTAADLRAEQEYFLARARRHNRYLNGWGVVHGLQVSAASGTQLVVTPGVAIDCAGNEIHVMTPITLTPKTISATQFIALRYSESLTAPIPTMASGSLDGDTTMYSRVREGFRLEVVATDPNGAHVGEHKTSTNPGTPGCGRAHALCIATVQLQRRGWVIKLMARR